MTVMTDTPRLDELKRRVQRDPASISFAALAEEYRRLGMFAEAIETCRAGLLRHPAYISARVTLGRALVEIGEFDEASAELEQVLRSAPENLAAIRALADIHRRRGEIPETPTTTMLPPIRATAPAPVVRATGFRAGPHCGKVCCQVAVAPAPPALVELEAFLAAIERARRDGPIHAASLTRAVPGAPARAAGSAPVPGSSR